jgi:hypothetical protein
MGTSTLVTYVWSMLHNRLITKGLCEHGRVLLWSKSFLYILKNSVNKVAKDVMARVASPDSQVN